MINPLSFHQTITTSFQSPPTRHSFYQINQANYISTAKLIRQPSFPPHPDFFLFPFSAEDPICLLSKPSVHQSYIPRTTIHFWEGHRAQLQRQLISVMLLIHEDQKIQNKSSYARKPSYSGGWVKKTEVEHNLSNNIRIILWKPTSKVLNPYKAYTKQIIWSKYYILCKVTVRKNREYIIFERNEVWASTLPQHQEVWILEIILYGFRFPNLKKTKGWIPVLQ